MQADLPLPHLQAGSSPMWPEGALDRLHREAVQEDSRQARLQHDPAKTEEAVVAGRLGRQVVHSLLRRRTVVIQSSAAGAQNNRGLIQRAREGRTWSDGQETVGADHVRCLTQLATASRPEM